MEAVPSVTKSATHTDNIHVLMSMRQYAQLHQFSHLCYGIVKHTEMRGMEGSYYA